MLPEIRRRRADIRAARGWVMDTYLLRPAGFDAIVPRALPAGCPMMEQEDGAGQSWH